MIVATLTLYGSIGVDLSVFGSAAASVDLSFGYDTYGIQKALETGNPLYVFDGFYANDYTMPVFKDGRVVPGTGGQEKPEFALDIIWVSKGNPTYYGDRPRSVWGGKSSYMPMPILMT